MLTSFYLKCSVLELRNERGWSNVSTRRIIIPHSLFNFLKSSPAHEAGVNIPTIPLTLPLPLSFFPIHVPRPSLLLFFQLSFDKYTVYLLSPQLGRYEDPGYREVNLGHLITLHIICLSDWQQLLAFVYFGDYFLFSSTYFPVREI